MRRNDYLLCAVILLLALGGFWQLQHSTVTAAATSVRISRDQTVLLEQNLADFPDAYTVPTAHGVLRLRKNGNTLAVTSAPCPDQLCVKQGPLRGSGVIVCVPEGVVIELHSQQEGAGPDALLR